MFFALLKKSSPKEKLQAIFYMENIAKKIKKWDNRARNRSQAETTERPSVFSRLGPTPPQHVQKLLGGDTRAVRSRGDVVSTEGVDLFPGVTGEVASGGRGGDGGGVVEEEGGGRDKEEVGVAEEEEEGEVQMDVDSVEVEQTVADGVPSVVHLDRRALGRAEEETAVREFESCTINFPTFVQLD